MAVDGNYKFRSSHGITRFFRWFCRPWIIPHSASSVGSPAVPSRACWFGPAYDVKDTPTPPGQVYLPHGAGARDTPHGASGEAGCIVCWVHSGAICTQGTCGNLIINKTQKLGNWYSHGTISPAHIVEKDWTTHLLGSAGGQSCNLGVDVGEECLRSPPPKFHNGLRSMAR
jgi:hypothetical protein